MYGLPNNIIRNAPFYKKAFFDKFIIKKADRDHFDADISKMVLVAQVIPSKIAGLAEGLKVKSFFVLQVQLKRKEYDPKNILLLQKHIAQKLVFALQFGEETQLCVFHTVLLHTEWMPTNDARVRLDAFSIDDVWQNIVAEIGKVDAASEIPMEEQILRREHQRKLLKQIESLEKQCRTEKQTRRKFELHQQIMKLKEELK